MEIFEAIGSAGLWGFSPSVDVLSHASEKLKAQESGEVNILLMGCSDISSVIKTLSRVRRHNKNLKLHFYIYDSKPDLIARQMLLLSTFLDETISIKEKTKHFMEIYGNVFLSRQTAEYVSNQTKKLIRLIGYEEGELLKVFKFDIMKHKERDAVEDVLKFWNYGSEVDILGLWDERCRGYYKSRYDVRKNLIDWDYYMNLKEVNGNIVNPQEYTKWRLEGMAFYYSSEPAEIPNKTMTTMAIGKQAGKGTVLKRGYWGDILVGPFISLGLEAEAPELFKKANQQYIKLAYDIIAYNLRAMWYELRTGVKYSYGDDEEEEKLLNSSPEVQMPEFSFSFLTGDSFSAYFSRSKFSSFFSFVVVGSMQAHYISKDMTAIASEDCTVLAETVRYLLSLKDEQKEAFITKVTQSAREAGMQTAVTTPKDSHMVFRFKQM